MNIDVGVRPSDGRPQRPKTACILQPYFFPYIGFFQIIAQSDVFVIYDDAQYMKGGWVNRNRILRDGTACWITYPVVADHYELSINQRFYARSADTTGRILRQVEAAYKNSLRFADVFPLLREIMAFDDANVAAFNGNLLRRVAGRLGAGAAFVLSSEIGSSGGLSGQERVIEMCKAVGAERYVNPIGGVPLYQAERFEAAGIELRFLRSGSPNSAAHFDSAAPFLSIIDTLMNCSDEALSRAMADFTIIRAQSAGSGSQG